MGTGSAETENADTLPVSPGSPATMGKQPPYVEAAFVFNQPTKKKDKKKSEVGKERFDKHGAVREASGAFVRRRFSFLRLFFSLEAPR